MKMALAMAAMFFLPVLSQATPYTLLTEELPTYSMTVDGKATGATVDIVTRLFQQAKIDFIVQIVPWKRAYVSALNNEMTCAFPMQRSQEREALFHWVSPIVITQTGLYTRDDSTHSIRTLEDVKHLTLGSYQGSAASEYLMSQGYELELLSNDTLNINKLRMKRIDAWAADTLTARHLMKKENAKQITERLVYFTTLRALACNLGTPNEVIKQLSDTLKVLYHDGSIEKIMKKYR